MTEKEKLLRNLKDAGCNSDIIQRFLHLEKEGKRKEQFRLLALHRKELLEKLHVSQNRIECLDYLVYTMKRNNKKETMKNEG